MNRQIPVLLMVLWLCASCAQLKSAAQVRQREEALRLRLEQTVIPALDFRQAAISDVVQCLHSVSGEFDPSGEKKRVNLVLSLTPAEAGQAPAITFAGQDMSVMDAVRTLCMLGRLTYRIEGNVVYLHAAP